MDQITKTDTTKNSVQALRPAQSIQKIVRESPSKSKLMHSAGIYPDKNKYGDDPSRPTQLRNQLVHTTEKNYPCPTCPKTFKWKSNLNNHMHVHSGIKKFSCPHCEKKFRTPGNLRQHLRVHTKEKPFQCPDCGERFRWRSTFGCHLRTHQKEGSDSATSASQPPKLREEPRISAYSYKRLGGTRRKIPARPPRLSKFSEPENSAGTFPEHKLIPFVPLARFGERHLASVAGKIIVRHGNSGIKLSQKARRGKVIKVNESEQGRNLCPTSENAQLDQHSEDTCNTEDEPERNSEGKPFCCNLCPKTFRYFRHLVQHRATHSKPTEKPKSRQSITHPTTSDKPFRCDQCPRAFRFFRTLSQHKGIHLRRKRFQCKRCSTSFKWPSLLAKHLLFHSADEINASGSEEKPFECQQCGKCFQFKNTLVRHAKMSHSQHEKLLNPVPESPTISYSVLDRHKKGKSTQRRNTQNLTKSYGSNLMKSEKRPLLPGIDTHLKTAEKPFRCDQCPRTFRLRGSLTQHKGVHLRRQKFQCRKCPTSFNRPSLLAKHLLVHSSDEINASGSEEKPFKCQQCGNCFKWKHNFVRHAKMSHPEHEELLNSVKQTPTISFSVLDSHKKAKSTQRRNTQENLSKTSGSPLLKSEKCQLLSRIDGIKREFPDQEMEPLYPECPEVQVKSEENSAESLKCPECDKILSRPDSLRRHRRQVHNSKASFQCQICQQQFFTLLTFQNHLKSHDRQKTWKCPQCPRRFPNVYSRSKHAISVHGNIQRSSHHSKPFSRKPRSPILITDPDETQKMFRCQECSMFFRNESILLAHQIIHGKVEAVPCPCCPQVISGLVAFRDHLKYHMQDL